MSLLDKDGFATEIVKQTREIAKEPAGNIMNPPTKVFGERLADVINLIFTPVELARIYKDHKIAQFEEKLAEKIEKIPEEKRIEPDISIIGPALEASKYYIDDETLRNMFANLIANSMNADTVGMTHPSFVEIVKQLSPFDAVNISGFKHKLIHAMVDYRSKILPEATILENVVLGVGSSMNIIKLSHSMTNLIRLGLLLPDYSTHLYAEEYEKYINPSIAQRLISNNIGSGFRTFDDIMIRKGIIRPTVYGTTFITACV